MEANRKWIARVIAMLMAVCMVCGSASSLSVQAAEETAMEETAVEIPAAEDSEEAQFQTGGGIEPTETGPAEISEETDVNENEATDAAEENEVPDTTQEVEESSDSGQETEEFSPIIEEEPAQVNEEPEKDITADKPEFEAFGSTAEADVYVYAPAGTFPEGTRMDIVAASSLQVEALAEQITGEDTAVVDLIAVDITFYNQNGESIQPTGENSVRVTLSARRHVAGESHAVIHVEEETGFAEILSGAAVDDVIAQFDADAFSVYGIIGTGKGEEIPRMFYHFYDSKELLEEISEQQIVKNGDLLLEPQIPAGDGAFLGWFYMNGNEEAAVEFGLITNFDSETDVIVNAYAKFQAETFSVVFHDSYGNIIQTISGENGTKVDLSKVRYTSETALLTGWNDGKNEYAPDETLVIAGADIDLYPDMTDSIWIHFDRNGGGTCTASQLIVTGQKAQKPDDPKRAGYTFKGWLDGNGRTVDFDQRTFQKTETLKASWEAVGMANYTILVWKEEVVDGKYEAGNYVLAATMTGNGKTGNKVRVLDGNITFEEKDYYTIIYDKTENNVEIKADGSTVVNVYYDLKEYTLKFQMSGNTDNGTRFCSVTKNGVVYGLNKETGKSSQYSFTARLGENIADKWPQPKELTVYVLRNVSTGWEADEDYKFLKWINGNFSSVSTFTPAIAKLAGRTDITFSPQFAYRPDPVTGYYYFQDANDKTKYEEDSNYHEVLYVTEDAVTQREIDGFEKTDYPGAPYPETNESAHYFYYNRKPFMLTFINDGRIVQKIDDVVYGQSINEMGFTPEQPASVLGDATFDGWYCDSAFRTEFVFDDSATMPANNLTLYAKWSPKVYAVRFDLDEGSEETSDRFADQEKKYGEKVDDPGKPVKDGATFQGWRVNGEPFSLETAVTEDIELVADWGSPQSTYLVKYVAENAIAPEDQNRYYLHASVMVLGEPAQISEDKVFLGWRLDGESENRTPYGFFTITRENTNDGVVTLQAVFADKPGTVSITFHANYPDGKDATSVVDGLKNNEDFELGAPAASNFTVPAGYAFTGWTTDQEGAGTLYSAGQSLAADTGTDNHVYAQWIPDEDKQYKVTYTADTGGSVNKEKDGPYQVFNTSDITGSVATADEGYVFVGWYKGEDSVCDTEYLDADTVIAELNKDGDGLNADTEFVAKFTKTPEIVLSVVESSRTKVYGDPDPALKVEITGDLDGKTYDVVLGRAKKTDGATEGENWAGTEFVGKYDIFVESIAIYDGSTDVTADYIIKNSNGKTVIEGETAIGTLEITKRPITVRAGSASKVYDAANPTPLTCTDVEVVSGELVKFKNAIGEDQQERIESVTMTDESTITNPGSVKNEIKLDGAGDPMIVIRHNPETQMNYDITVEPGTLTVTEVTTPVPETPDPTPTPPTPTPAVVYYPVPVPVAAPAEAPEVLGVRREVTVDPEDEVATVLGVRRQTGQDSPDVLGSRRGETGDERMMFHYVTLLFAVMLLLQLTVDERRRSKMLR